MLENNQTAWTQDLIWSQVNNSVDNPKYHIRKQIVIVCIANIVIPLNQISEGFVNPPRGIIEHSIEKLVLKS